MSPTFEDRLLVELTALLEPETGSGSHALRAHRRHGRVALVGAAAAIVAAGAAAAIVPTVVLGGHGRAAYAVSRGANGTVTLAVHSAVTTPMRMQHDLRAAGTPVRVLPLTYRGACHPGSRNVATPDGSPVALRDPRTLEIRPARMPAHSTLVVEVPTTGSGSQPIKVSLSADGTPACAH